MINGVAHAYDILATHSPFLDAHLMRLIAYQSRLPAHPLDIVAHFHYVHSMQAFVVPFFLKNYPPLQSFPFALNSRSPLYHLQLPQVSIPELQLPWV